MFRPVARAGVRAASNPAYTNTIRRIPTRRWASTGADKPRSWKSGLARWGLAGAVVYYYNTNNLFADDKSDQYAHIQPPAASDSEELPTLESYAKKPALPSSQSPEKYTIADGAPTPTPTATGGVGDLEAEASQQGAFNEETGEINWDCPCLGGMANGPCGEDFKAAFSCFVYSQEEPKGVDCIDKFKAMQDCFRAHPDIYGAELEDDEEEGALEGEAQPALARDGGSSESAPSVADSAVPAIDNVKAKVSSVKDGVQEKLSSLKDDAQNQYASAKAEAEKQYASAKVDSERSYANAKNDANERYSAAKEYAQEKGSDLKHEIESTAAAVKDKIGSVRATSAKDDKDESASIAKRSVRQEPGEVSESESLVPKAAHDARDYNNKK